MKYLSVIFFSILSFFIQLSLNAQTNFRLYGKVSSKNLGISANVVVYKLSDSTIVAYSPTDSIGNYALSFAYDEIIYFVKAQSMGYEESIFFLEKKNTYLNDPLNFELDESSKNLAEIVIKAQAPPYTTKKDTITYNPKAFSDGMEHSVEELLRKMPGIKVSENGDISVRGKPIDKITLEGEDIFGKNYKLISKNIAANLIDKIEAIDNYTESELLRDVDKSNKIILNLKIINKKNLFFGNASAELGTRSRYELTSTAFSLIKQLKVGVVANTNNIGIDPIQNSQYELNDEKDVLRKIDYETNSLRLLSNSSSFGTPDLPVTRYTFNKAGLIGVNLNYQLNKKSKVKGFFFLNTDKLSLGNQINTQFFLPDNDIKYKESSTFYKSPRLFTGQLIYDFYPTKTSSIRFIAIQKSTKTTSYYNINSENIALSENIPSNAYDEVNLESYKINLIKRLKGKNVISANLNFQINEFPQSATVESNRFGVFFNNNNDFASLLQQRNFLKNNELQGSLSWIGTNNRSTWAINLISSKRNEFLSSDLFFQVKNMSILRNDSLLKNQNIYQKNSIILDTDYKFSIGAFKFSLGGGLHNVDLRFNNLMIEKKSSQNIVFFNPIGGLSYQINENQKMIAFFTSAKSVPNIIDLSNGYILSNYRTFERGISNINITKSNYFSSIYSNTDWKHLLTIVGSINIGKTFSPYVYQFNITNNINLMTKQVVDNAITQYSTNWVIEKLISSISTKIKYEIGGTLSERINLINSSQLVNITIQNINNNLHFTTVFDGITNFDFGIQFNYSKLLGTNLKTIMTKPFGIIRIKPAKWVSLKIIDEAFIWRNNSVKNLTNFMDFYLQINPKNPKWTVELKGFNITNTKLAFFSEITNYSFIEKSFALQPRYFSFRIDRKF